MFQVSNLLCFERKLQRIGFPKDCFIRSLKSNQKLKVSVQNFDIFFTHFERNSVNRRQRKVHKRL